MKSFRFKQTAFHAKRISLLHSDGEQCRHGTEAVPRGGCNKGSEVGREETVCQNRRTAAKRRSAAAVLPEMGGRPDKPDEMKWGTIKVLRRRYAKGGLGLRRFLPQAKKLRLSHLHTKPLQCSLKRRKVLSSAAEMPSDWRKGGEKMSYLENLKKENSRTLTLNGAAAYNGTGNACLDLFAVAGGMRYRSSGDLYDLFDRALIEEPDLAMKLLFYIRDIRGGMGERRVFRVLIRHTAFEWPDSVRKNVHLIAEYGRWDDLF